MIRDAFDRVNARREEHQPQVGVDETVEPREMVGQIVESLQDSGSLWVAQLLGEEGLGDEMAELLDTAQALADITTPNLAALVELGVFGGKEYGDACIAAGFAVGLLTGLDLARARTS